MRSPMRRALLITAAIATVLMVYVVGYIALRKVDVINDFTQNDSGMLSGRWAALANGMGEPAYWLELRWRITRMDERWQRCVDAGLCPDGERQYDDRWARFWYRQGYIDAIPAAVTSAVCGHISFGGPLLHVPAVSYQHGMFDGDRIVQRVVSDFLVERGVPRWNGHAKPVDEGIEQIEFSGTGYEHAQFQDALVALREKLGVSQAPGPGGLKSAPSQ